MVGKPQSAEMHPGPGFRLRYDFERPDPGDGRGPRPRFPTPEISDLMNRLYAMVPADQEPDRPGQPPHLRARRCTVKVYPGDNLMVHKSLDLAQPGDVIVVDTELVLADRRARRPGLHEGPAPRRRRASSSTA